LNFLSLLAVRVARDERQEIVQRHDEITPGAALCIAVEYAARDIRARLTVDR